MNKKLSPELEIKLITPEYASEVFIIKDSNEIFIKHNDSLNYKLIYKIDNEPIISSRLGYINYKIQYIKDTVITDVDPRKKLYFFKLDTVFNQNFPNAPFNKIEEAIDQEYFIPMFRYVEAPFQDSLTFNIITITKEIRRKDLPDWYIKTKRKK